MKPAMTLTKIKPWKIGGIVLTITLAALIGGLSSIPARADDDDRGRNVQREHSERDRHRPSYRSHRSYYEREAPPRYIYAPPPVYYAPPPRPPVFDFVFPLVFR